MVVVLQLSKSGKAVLVFPGDGSVFMTSVKWLRMLLDGRANGGKIVCTPLAQGVDRGLASGGLQRDLSKRLENVSGFEGF